MKEEKGSLELEDTLWNLLLAEHSAPDKFELLINYDLVDEKILLSEHPWSKKNPIFQGINLLWCLVVDSPLKKTKLTEIFVNWTKKNLITTQMLMSTPKNEEHSDYGANLVSVWVNRQNCLGSPISDWVEKKLITPQILEAKFENKKHYWYGANTMWLMLHNILPYSDIRSRRKSMEILPEEKAYREIFRNLSKGGLITELMLMDHPKRENCDEFGINGLWIMAKSQQWELIGRSITKKFVTVPMLESNPRNSRHSDHAKNVLQLLANEECWDLIGRLLGKNLITPSMLISKDMFYGTNVLWQIVINREWTLLKTMHKNDLITTPALLSVVDLKGGSEIIYGFSMAKWLIMKEQWNSVELLVDKINTQILLSAGKDNINAMHLLLKSKNTCLIKQLLAAPLNPLKEVPWESFDIKPLMSLLQEQDPETFTGLRKLVQDYNPYHATIVSTTPDYITVDSFHYNQQRKYWNERAMRDIQNELLSVCLFVLINQWRPNALPIPLSLIYLIFFYTSGSQHGLEYIFPDNALELSLSSGNKIEPTLKSKDLVEKYFQNGVTLFAMNRLIQEEIIFETADGLSL